MNGRLIYVLDSLFIAYIEKRKDTQTKCHDAANTLKWERKKRKKSHQKKRIKEREQERQS